MTPMDTLPTEILLDIVSMAFASVETEDCEIGYDAAWNLPRANDVQVCVTQPSRPHTPLLDTLPFPEGLVEDIDEESNDVEEKRHGFFALATSLRLYVPFLNSIFSYNSI
jgi:hypothetical protein